MNKLIDLLIIICIISISGTAMAQDSETELPDAGVGPDSALYALDLAMERISMSWGDPVEKRLQISMERLAEAKEMAERGNIDAMNVALERHEELLIELEDYSGEDKYNTERAREHTQLVEKVHLEIQ